MNINPEILSQVPTHKYMGEDVKVFTDTLSYDLNGEAFLTAEIMSGENKGKWTTVQCRKLIINPHWGIAGVSK